MGMHWAIPLVFASLNYNASYYFILCIACRENIKLIDLTDESYFKCKEPTFLSLQGS